MTIASRTPEGESNRCSFCGKRSELEPSITTWDAPCPHCGWLMWYESAEFCEPSSRNDAFAHWIDRFRELKAAGRLRFSLPHALITCARELTTARGAAVWRAGADEEWSLLANFGIPAATLLDVDKWRRHATLLTSVAHCPEIDHAPPNANPVWQGGNVSDSLLWLQRICREDHVLVFELFLPARTSYGELQILDSFGRILHDLVAVPIGSAPRFEPGIALIPSSSVDPPVKLPTSDYLPHKSWWRRLLNVG